MAYYDVSLLCNDLDFVQRSMAAYAVETLSNANAETPDQWWMKHNWDMAAMPGFSDQYASGLAGGIVRPGRDPAVITDPQILSAVQSIQNQAPAG